MSKDMDASQPAIPDDSLAERFKTWSPQKQQSLLISLAAYQVHSFALSGIELDQEQVLTETRRLLQDQ